MVSLSRSDTCRENKKVKLADLTEYFKTKLPAELALESLTGEAEFVHTRGKRKIGYDLTFNLTHKESGVIEITEFCDDLSDPESQGTFEREATYNQLRQILEDYRLNSLQ